MEDYCTVCGKEVTVLGVTEDLTAWIVDCGEHIEERQ